MERCYLVDNSNGGVEQMKFGWMIITPLESSDSHQREKNVSINSFVK